MKNWKASMQTCQSRLLNALEVYMVFLTSGSSPIKRERLFDSKRNTAIPFGFLLNLIVIQVKKG